MKKIIALVAFVWLSVNLSAQKQLVDSSNVIDEVNYMKYCMHRQSRQHTIGSSLIFGGIVLTSISLVTKVDKPILYTTSAVLATIGTIVVLDANKWFKRASVGLNGNGMTVTYTFK